MNELRFSVLRRLRPFVPRSSLGKLTAYFWSAWAALAAVSAVATRAGATGTAGFAGGVATFVLWVASGCLMLLGFRWFKQRFLWRLRNRLMVSYVLIGVVPVMLIALLVGLGFLLFSVQYTTSQAMGEVEGELRSLDLLNGEVLQQHEGAHPAIAGRIPISAATRDRFPGLSMALYRDGQRVSQSAGGAPESLPGWVKGPFRGIVREGNGLYLRSLRFSGDEHPLVAYSSVPVSKKLLDQLFADFGSVRFSAVERVKAQSSSPQKSQSNFKLLQKNKTSGAEEEREYSFHGDTLAEGGTLAPQLGRWDTERGVGSFSEIRDWADGGPSILVLYVKSRPSTVYLRLFANRGDMATGAVVGMIAVAVAFGILEVIALVFGLGLSRTITQSVANLYQATQHINRGDLAHRIRIKRKDQLAALQGAFNSMSENLEKLIEEQKEKQRLESEIAIAQEVQKTLFPQELSPMRTLEVHGMCQPARSVSGDYYDFIPCGAEQLAIAVGDISGKGISAALLMATIHSAVRVYEYGGVPSREEMTLTSAAHASAESGGPAVAVHRALQSPAIVLELLNRHLYLSTPPEKYATLFLGVFDGATRTLTYSNAGHLPPMIVGADGTVRRLEISGTVIGLFESILFLEHAVRLAAGDLFVAFSDGVTEPENDFGEFGEQRLTDILRQFRGAPLERIQEEVLHAVQDWIGAAEQPDDVTLVLARAR